MYTRHMPITSSLPCPVVSSRVIIDWSEGGFQQPEAAKPEEVEKLLAWVKSYPRRRDIHVYLRNPMMSVRVRTLQHKLQALGCTVTTTCYRAVAVR